jgi:hypothetical protein
MDNYFLAVRALPLSAYLPLSLPLNAISFSRNAPLLITTAQHPKNAAQEGKMLAMQRKNCQKRVKSDCLQPP